MRVLVTVNLKDEYLDMIREAASDIELVKALDVETQKREIVDAEVLAGGSSADRELLEAADNLKLIQTWSAGVEDFTTGDIVEVLKRKGIKLVNMSGIHGDPIAEHVMGLIINYSRGLYRLYEYQQEQKWQRINVGQLEDRTMTIVGTGSIGREIARRAKAFKMKTIGVKRTIKNELEFFDRLFTDDDLQRALQEADYVVVTVPLTTETRGMFGEREFEAMKETAFFVNIARGAVVDEQAMIEALKKGIIAGAGLDVFEIEPLPADSPLYRLENVYLTPHISGLHPDYNLKAIRLFVDNLQRYSRGEKLLNLVDYGVGY